MDYYTALKKYADIIQEGAAARIEEKKNQATLAALDIELSATEIVNLLRDPERLNVVVKKLKLKPSYNKYDNGFGNNG